MGGQCFARRRYRSSTAASNSSPTGASRARRPSGGPLGLAYNATGGGRTDTRPAFTCLQGSGILDRAFACNHFLCEVERTDVAEGRNRPSGPTLCDTGGGRSRITDPQSVPTLSGLWALAVPRRSICILYWFCSDRDMIERGAKDLDRILIETSFFWAFIPLSQPKAQPGRSLGRGHSVESDRKRGPMAVNQYETMKPKQSRSSTLQHLKDLTLTDICVPQRGATKIFKQKHQDVQKPREVFADYFYKWDFPAPRTTSKIINQEDEKRFGSHVLVSEMSCLWNVLFSISLSILSTYKFWGGLKT